MQTYSHVIITAVLNRLLKQKEAQEQGKALTFNSQPLPPLRTGATLLGSFAPDVPLITVTIFFIVLDRLQGNPMGFEANRIQSWTGWLFEYAFFNVWWVKMLHNLFHAPLMILAYALIGMFVWRRGKAWGAKLFWFALSCMLHTAIDIPLHYDDGPLVFFPLDWSTRVYSPVSYWDPNRYGTIVALLEHLLIAVLLLYLGMGWWKKRRQQLSQSMAA